MPQTLFRRGLAGFGATLRRDNQFDKYWWARKDLNLGPTDYESAALTAELRAPRGTII